MQHTDVIRSMMPSCWFAGCVLLAKRTGWNGKTKTKIASKMHHAPANQCWSAVFGGRWGVLIAYHYSVFVSGAIVDKANCLCCIVLWWFVFASEWAKVLGWRGDDAASNKRPEQLWIHHEKQPKTILSSTRMWYICSKRRITGHYVRGLAPIRGSCLMLFCIWTACLVWLVCKVNWRYLWVSGKAC